jgi:hypothetical protein
MCSLKDMNKYILILAATNPVQGMSELFMKLKLKCLRFLVTARSEHNCDIK